jgi:hypothetical protein
VFGSAAANLYLWSHSLFCVVQGGSQVLFEGFWMGLLPEGACDLISQKSYGDGESYSGKAWLDSGLFFWEELVVRRFFSAGCRVLVGAAGGGREVIALARMGFAVDAFECSRPMVAKGQRALEERSIAATLQWAPPCQAPPLTAVYGALIVGWNGYTYILPRQRRIDFMKSLRNHLKPNAPVLVSGAFGSPGSRSARWTCRVANFVRVCTFRSPAFEPGDFFPGRPRHTFTRPQMERELAEAGFTPAAFYRWGPFGAVVCLAQQSDAH